VKYFKSNKNALHRKTMKIRLLAPLDDIRKKLYTNKFLVKGKSNPKFI
jgi:hypothetical protein